MPRDRSDLGKAEVANLGYVLAKWWTANGAKTNAKFIIKKTKPTARYDEGTWT